MAYNKPTDTEADDRPRHVRLAEQELKKGGKLVINYEKDIAFVLRDAIRNTLSVKQAEEAKKALEEEYGDQISVIDGGWEKLTTSEVIERWPSLEEHYDDAQQALYNRGYSGKLTRSKDGGTVLWHIDEAFREWLDSLGVDSAGGTEAQDEDAEEAEEASEPEETEKENGAEEESVAFGLQGVAGNAEAVADWMGENGSPAETNGERPIERLLKQLRFAHLEYVRTLHEGGDLEAAQEAVEETTSLIRERLKETLEVVRLTERSAGIDGSDQGGIRSPRVDGVLSRITGDERLEEKKA